MFFILLCCCLAALLCQDVLGEGEFHIKNASDLIGLSKNVNSGTSYKGTTVFLDADIDFSSGGHPKEFGPIGTYDGWYNYKDFQGTFDGQGHTISNLAVKSSLYYVGLFGYSRGVTIRNVVLDSSCSVLCTPAKDSGYYLGGIIGYLHSEKEEPCSNLGCSISGPNLDQK